MKQFDIKNIRKEWVDLVEDFPEIFLKPSPDVLHYYEESIIKEWNNVPEKTVDLCNLRYGFECDIGWKQIIREFCEEIRRLIENAKNNGDEIHYNTFILKEKFGECHSQGDFYGPDYKKYQTEYHQIVENLMTKSSKVCELTGTPGKLVKRNYWCKTLCEEEAEKWINYK